MNRYDVSLFVFLFEKTIILKRRHFIANIRYLYQITINMLKRIITTSTSRSNSLLGLTSCSINQQHQQQFCTTTATSKTTTTSTTTTTTNEEIKLPKLIKPRVHYTPINAKLASTMANEGLIDPKLSKLFKGEVLLEGIKNDGTTLKWYKHVGYTYDQEKGGYVPTLDNRAMKTPCGNHFVLPTKELAMAVAAEWHTQTTYIKPSRLPLSSALATCVDLTPEQRLKSITEIVGHLKTDPVCNREADESSKMRKLQDEKLDPVFEFANAYYGGGKNFKMSYGLNLSKHLPATLKRIQDHLGSLSNFHLLALQFITSSSKSFLCALAIYHQHVRLDGIYDTVAIEEEYQADIWGKIPFGHDLAEMETLNEIAPALFILRCLDPLPLPPSKPKRQINKN
ncbi:ATP synthase mitochondrial F1 complex assembly factor 2 [Cavenderia fasciculata]|uniref:ATP synthase mitochondrial F1 complex assembly factor 2 n=1 Tax=Cavenderia fasciculata TaxID=261658 RepID=F4Q6B2_CACFS|nr:ATP synthase mitochondrial F1 complex assembly factor 2 [Cavenderia fasciculata]EGG16422.1 ATP synthase mitochondrial F1 complex assembly factor 2 [Cavenderia fasciculata]|eukprot:XP_004354822.1 ATP synthase mitochondrial F1 complex assembly factor 2 [Cavenderia fasciculata]